MNTAVSARPLKWRLIDIVTAAVIGVAAGLVFWAWNLLSDPVTAPLKALLPGLQGLVYGVWLIAGVLGALIIRKPGAAIFTELVAAIASALLGSSYGLPTLQSGLVQGLGAEIIFLLFFYRSFGPGVAVLAGAGAGAAMAVNDLLVWYVGADTLFMVTYSISAVISGAVIAGLGSWALTKALAKTGALAQFGAGREVAKRV